jgi:hypothetical protein
MCRSGKEAAMIRKQFFIREDQQARLKAQAAKAGVPFSTYASALLVREARGR